MLEFKQISLLRGRKTLLENASARIEKNYRVGLIGRNGAGKSTLMQLLMGKLQEDAGEVNLEVPRSEVVYLEQELPQCDNSAIEYVKNGDHAWHKIQIKLQLAEVENDGIAIGECHAQLQDIDGYTIDSRAGKILHGLGFSNEQLALPIATFSGGWQMRLQLARVLISRAELLLLDEPTNHLDIDAIIWLEHWLKQQNNTLILISHDRDFLDRVCTQTLHLAQQKLKLYQGNYSSFAKQFELQIERESQQQAKILKQRAHMQNFVDRFRAKASKAKQAQGRMKAIEKLTLTPGLQRENPFHFNFLPCTETSNPMLNTRGDMGYPKATILNSVSMRIDYGDRIGLIGRNGEGKTTLMKTLAGELPIIKGGLTYHTKINIAYFSQQQLDKLDLNNTPIGHFLALDPKLSDGEARRFLGGFAFSGDRVFDNIKNFSGGEKARLALALLIYQRPNLLLLDEPTNHLDIQMREALSIALQEFTGTVVLVSHDRHFMSSVVDTLWCVSNGKVSPFTGDLDEYQRIVLTAEDQVETNEPSSSAPVKKAKPSNKKLKKLETKIAKLSEQVKELEVQLTDDNLYKADNAEKLHDLVSEHETLAEKLKLAEKQWLQLMDND